MSEPARRYRSQVRDEQARRTRRAIVSAAHDLFVSQGYAATTIDAVARAANVSRRTVFNAVGGKAALLKLALDWAITGDDEPVPMADRPAVRAIQAESDSRRALGLWAQMVTETSARVVLIGEVLTAAADVDAAAAELLAVAKRDRLAGAAAFTGYLASRGGLAPGISRQQAADLCWTVMDGHLYRSLVLERGWTDAQYTRWLSAALAATLLAG